MNASPVENLPIQAIPETRWNEMTQAIDVGLGLSIQCYELEKEVLEQQNHQRMKTLGHRQSMGPLLTLFVSASQFSTPHSAVFRCHTVSLVVNNHSHFCPMNGVRWVAYVAKSGEELLICFRIH